MPRKKSQKKERTPEQVQAARERMAKARAAKSEAPKMAEAPQTVQELLAENERLKAEIARQTLSSMQVMAEEEPHVPKKFLDDEDWHYFLCIKSKSDEEDEEAEKCSRDPDKGGYSVAPGGRISARKVWLRIPQALYQSRKQKGVDEAKAKWQRPQGQDVRDGLIAQKEQREQYVGAA
jgi:hypothetical protein